MTSKTLITLLFLSSITAHASTNDQSLIVTATRGTSAKVAPATHTSVITREQIMSSGASNVGELLRSLAGVQLAHNQSNTIISMRGFSAEQAANNVLILVDGRRLNHGDIAAPYVEQIPLEQVERIELLKGSASILYGDQAVAGVINIITQTYQSALGTASETDLQLQLGEFAQSRTGIRHTQVINDALRIHADFHHLNSDGYREHNEHSQKRWQVSADWQQASGSRWKFSLSSLKDDRQTPGALPLALFRETPRLSLPEFASDYTDQNSQHASVSFNQAFDAFDLFVNLDHQSDDIDSLTSFLGFASTTVANTERDSLQFSPRIQGSWNTDYGQAEWLMGIDVLKLEYDFDLLARTNEQTQRALYASINWPISESLSLTTGLRHTKVKDELKDPLTFVNETSLDERANNWSIGLEQRYSSSFSSFIKAESNFRFAKVDEQAYTSPGVIGLKPQTGESIELGIRVNTDWLSLTLSAFQLTLEDEIVFDINALAPTGAFFPGANVNLDASERDGLMLDANIELNDAWSIALAYTLLDARFTKGSNKGRRIPSVAEEVLSSSLGYQQRGMKAFLEATYTSERYQDGDNANLSRALNAYTLVSLGIHFALDEYEDFSFTLRMNNLFDEQYAAFAQFDGYYPGDGRQLSLRLDYRL